MSISEISRALNQYSTSQLLRVHREFLQGFVEEHQELYQRHGVEASSHHDRHSITMAMAAIFFYSDVLEAFLESLPEPQRKVFLSVIWDGRQRVDYLEAKYKVAILASRSLVKKPVEAMYPHYLLLAVRYKNSQLPEHGPLPYYNLELDLAPEVSRHVKTISKPPMQAELQLVPELPEALFVYESSPAFFDEFQTLQVYTQQHRWEKMTAASYKKMQRQLGLQEFAPDQVKKLALLRSRLMLQFMLVCQPYKMQATQAQDQLKEFFRSYRAGSYYNLPQLLTHLKGKKTMLREDTSVNNILFETLPELPYMQWVSAASLVAHIRYYRPELLPFKFYMVRNMLYVEQGPEKEKSFVDDTLYFEYINEPLIKGTFFLYAALGLVDIAFTEPAAEAVSVFDGLAYVRLTPLGAYVCGLNPTYHPPKADEGALGFELDEQRLLITVTGSSKLNALLLEKYAEKIGEKLYRVSYESFLQGCDNLKDIESKISKFGMEISATPSPVWEEFLMSLLDRFNSISRSKGVRVYQLPVQDKKLISFVAKDEMLKRITQKAENYQVLVPEKQVEQFKARLRQFGYIWKD